MSQVIQPGSFVVIKMHDDKSTNIIKVEGSWKINRKYLDTAPLVGHPYGSIFEIKDGKEISRLEGVHTLDVADDANFAETLSKKVGENGDKGANNDWYADSNTAQKLKPEDIAELREKGVDNVNIMKKLVENSETWASKSSFAQEKWLRRKARKYLPRFRVEKCTPVTVCNVYRIKNAGRICGIRTDSLGRLMSHGDIHAGKRVLIFEDCLGLVVGSAAYRMRGYGSIVALYGKHQPHLEIVHKLDLQDKDRAIIQPAPSNDVGPAAALVAKHGFTAPVHETYQQQQCVEVADKDRRDEGGREEKGVVRSWQKSYNSTGRQLWDRQKIRALLTAGFDSLIIASHFEPLPVLKACCGLLLPSSPIVIYSEHVEPLNECFTYLNDQVLGLRVTIGDTWLREFQVLAGRTHPAMSMVASGGFVLTAIFVGAECQDKRDSVLSKRLSSSSRSNGGANRPKHKRRR